MSKDKFHNADGSMSAYALACGYLQRSHWGTGREGSDMRRLELSHNGSCYEINVTAYGPSHGPRRRIELAGNAPGYGGGSMLAGWAQVDTLTEARKLYRQYQRRIANGEALELELLMPGAVAAAG